MVDVFKFNQSMEGNTYYLKPIPFNVNGKFTYTPLYTFATSYPQNQIGSPIFRHISYCIVNGELKLHIYGSTVAKIVDYRELMPINMPKVAKVNVKVMQGFLHLTDSKIVDLDKCNIDYKDKFIIKDMTEYNDLIKDTSEEQLYQVVSEECNLILSYTTEQKVINGINILLSSMKTKMRGMKIKKLKECIH